MSQNQSLGIAMINYKCLQYLLEEMTKGFIFPLVLSDIYICQRLVLTSYFLVSRYFFLSFFFSIRKPRAPLQLYQLNKLYLPLFTVLVIVDAFSPYEV